MNLSIVFLPQQAFHFSFLPDPTRSLRRIRAKDEPTYVHTSVINPTERSEVRKRHQVVAVITFVLRVFK